MESNSSTNQEIKRRLVDREVYYCVSMLVQECMEKGVMDYDDIEHFYEIRADLSDGEWTGSEDERTERIEELEEIETRLEEMQGTAEELRDEHEEAELDTANDQRRLDAIEKRLETTQSDIEELKGAESEPQEIYEWWIVSGWLLRRLRELGEPVMETHGLDLWGRTCTGQAILLDYTMTRIAEGMEILEGQRHDWSRKEGVPA